MASEAARLAEALRAAKKDQALSGSQIAEQIERLTGSRPSLMWVTRRLRGQVPLVRVAPEFYALARALGVDPQELLAEIMASAVDGAAPAEISS